MTTVPIVVDPAAGAGAAEASPRDSRTRTAVGPPNDTVDDLVERLRPIAARAVDALQVAASLESEGITDEIARSQYGHADVFVLAQEVYRRAGSPELSSTPTTAPSQDVVSAARDMTHGVLYLLPAAIFPAGLAVLGRQSLVLGLVFAAGLGWVWAGGATWLAYRLLGFGYAGSAARVLRWSALAGLPVAAGASVVVVAATNASYSLTAMAVVQMTYQMAAALLMFYGREVWLFVAMVPAVATGVGYVVAGERLLALAIITGCGSVALAFVIALCGTKGRANGPEPRLRDGVRSELRQLPLLLLYVALTAAFLLHGQGRYMLTRVDIVVAYLPLIVGMGVVEWRARRFGEKARALLSSVRYPREFVPRIWLLVARDIGACVGVVAALAVVLLVALGAADLLSTAAVLMTAASVLLAGAYFVGFVLANMARYTWLCASLAASIAMHVAVLAAAPGELSPVADTATFLGSTTLLFLLFLTALADRVGQARYHR